MLILRRRHGGELGGPRTLKIISSAFFVMLWLFYLGMSIAKGYCQAVRKKNEKYIYNLFTIIIKLLPNFYILTNGKKPYLIILSSKFIDRVIRGNSESLINLQTSN